MDDIHLSLILATEISFSFIILGLEYPFAHLIEPYRPVKHHFHYFARSDSTSMFGHRPTDVRPNAIHGVPACHDTIFFSFQSKRNMIVTEVDINRKDSEGAASEDVKQL